MKKEKRLLTVLLCMAVMVVGIMVPERAKAENPKTYTLTYEDSTWYFRTVENGARMEASIIGNYFADGDSIVVNAASTAPDCNLAINKNIGDVCVTGGVIAFINTSAKVSRAYAVSGSTCVINGNVGTVLASANGVINVNGNVETLTADYTSGNAKYGISGTVAKAFAKINSQTPDNWYGIKAGKMVPDTNGIVWLSDGEYSTVPIATPIKTSDKKELDDVPKTGMFTFEISLGLIFAAALFGCASIVSFRKKIK